MVWSHKTQAYVTVGIVSTTVSDGVGIVMSLDNSFRFSGLDRVRKASVVTSQQHRGGFQVDASIRACREIRHKNGLEDNKSRITNERNNND